MTITLTTIVLYAIATARLTRLLTMDAIAAPVRALFFKLAWNGNRKVRWAWTVHTIIECPWCASVYIAPAVIALSFSGTWWKWTCLALTFSMAAGWMNERAGG